MFPTLPGGGSTRAAIAIFEHVFIESLRPIFPRLAAPTSSVLNPPSDQIFRAAREKRWGNIDELAASGPIRDKMWKEVKEGFDRLAGFLEKDGDGKLFYLGNTFSFADVVAISFLAWVKIVLGEESEEWKTVTSWNNGRWANLVESKKELLAVEN